jgi:hypothetical protein
MEKSQMRLSGQLYQSVFGLAGSGYASLYIYAQATIGDSRNIFHRVNDCVSRRLSGYFSRSSIMASLCKNLNGQFGLAIT